MHRACINQEDNIVELLLIQGIEVDAKNDEGNTALYYYVFSYNCNLKILELLLDRANINSVNKQGETPLMIAVKHYKIPVMQTLLNRNANTFIENIQGETVYDIAEKIDDVFKTQKDKILKILNDHRTALLADSNRVLPNEKVTMQSEQFFIESEAAEMAFNKAKQGHVTAYNHYEFWNKVMLATTVALAILLTPLSLVITLPLFAFIRSQQTIQKVAVTPQEFAEIKKNRIAQRLSHIDNKALNSQIHKPKKVLLASDDKKHVFLMDKEQKRRFLLFKHPNALTANELQQSKLKSKEIVRGLTPLMS